MRISIETHITCDFPEGRGPDPLFPPLDPSILKQSLPLEVSKGIPSPCHCH